MHTTHIISSLFLLIQGGSFKHFAICFLQRTDHSAVKASDKKNDDAVIKQNGHSNGSVGTIISNKASDYYVKSEDLTTNLTQRTIQQEPEQ
jgi:hypothetical protein